MGQRPPVQCGRLDQHTTRTRTVGEDPCAQAITAYDPKIIMITEIPRTMNFITMPMVRFVSRSHLRQLGLVYHLRII
jgi:hypothetical protein